MNKKIALLLIMFMVGSWCVFADDGDDYMTAIWIVLGVGFVLTMVLILTGNPEAGNSVWEATTGQSIMDYEVKTQKEMPAPSVTVLNNPIVKHTAFDFDKDKVFVGVRFAW